MSIELNKFRLYVVGKTPSSEKIVNGVNRMLKQKLDGSCSIEVIDLLTTPDKAATDNIIATPTLVRASPGPVMKIIGDLTDSHEILKRFGLNGKDEVAQGHLKKPG